MLLSSSNFSFSFSFRNYIIFIWWRFNLSNDSDRHEKMLQVSNFCVLGVGWCRKHVSACVNPRFVAYGKNITSNILESVKYEGHDADAVMLDIVLVLITLHLLLSFVIVINPVSQSFEEFWAYLKVGLNTPRVNLINSAGSKGCDGRLPIP